ncbi:MAG: hypothetical protein BWY54_00101 [Candidatus Dependentiae bacterium ADurb.Bin331]|nr:MAG: hypothetical protein BWY54_00101 [Candidatus Dependentiae bacterium ADurb.Bin331]
MKWLRLGKFLFLGTVLFFLESYGTEVSVEQAKMVMINLAKNHPYMTSAALVGFWSLLNYVLDDEDDEEENASPKSLFVSIFLCGIALDCIANGADSVPGTCYWLAKEFSERSILTFFPWLGWQGIKSLFKKLY